MEIHLSQLGTAPRNSPVLLILTDGSVSLAMAERWGRGVGEEFALYVLSSDLPSSENVESFAESLNRHCRKEGMRRVTVLGVGRGANVALAFTVAAAKLVRRLVVLNGTSRLAPGLFARAVDAVEEFLPLGLPLRPLSKTYDARPTLHRIHCPVLVLVSRQAGSFVRDQAALLAARIPNAWRRELSQPELAEDGRLSDELRQTLREFLQVPVKRPQKSAAER